MPSLAALCCAALLTSQADLPTATGDGSLRATCVALIAHLALGEPELPPLKSEQGAATAALLRRAAQAAGGPLADTRAPDWRSDHALATLALGLLAEPPPEPELRSAFAAAVQVLEHHCLLDDPALEPQTRVFAVWALSLAGPLGLRVQESTWQRLDHWLEGRKSAPKPRRAGAAARRQAIAALTVRTLRTPVREFADLNAPCLELLHTAGPGAADLEPVDWFFLAFSAYHLGGKPFREFQRRQRLPGAARPLGDWQGAWDRAAGPETSLALQLTALAVYYRYARLSRDW